MIARVLSGERSGTHFVQGASFVLDAPSELPALWGSGSDALWCRGESLMIAGPQGVGKTTLAGQLVKAMLTGSDVLGFEVERAERVLYLAMDRPKQIQRSLGRIFSAHDRLALDGLVVWEGPPPSDMAINPDQLAALADEVGANVVVVDSLKDAALRLSDDATGGGYNRARQTLLQSGCELIELHHTTKQHASKEVTGIDRIYGSTWLTAGAGSVVHLSGDPGDPIVGFKHLKQPAEEVGPFTLVHDQARGELSVEHEPDLPAFARAAGAVGVTARDAARYMTQRPKPSPADIAKATRKLDKLVDSGALDRNGGYRGGAATTWTHTNNSQCTPIGKVAGRGNHSDHPADELSTAPPKLTPLPKRPAQANHAANHANHEHTNHAFPPSFKEGEEGANPNGDLSRRRPTAPDRGDIDRQSA